MLTLFSLSTNTVSDRYSEQEEPHGVKVLYRVPPCYGGLLPGLSSSRQASPWQKSYYPEHPLPFHRTSSMTAAAGHTPDLVVHQQLLDLTNQLGLASCQQFVGNYVSLWQNRYERLCTAITNEDDDAAMDVVLSIKISSEMAGAQRLACLARCAQQRLGQSGAAELASMLTVIAACGKDTMSCLIASLE